jgi:hypothetical protein
MRRSRCGSSSTRKWNGSTQSGPQPVRQAPRAHREGRRGANRARRHEPRPTRGGCRPPSSKARASTHRHPNSLQPSPPSPRLQSIKTGADAGAGQVQRLEPKPPLLLDLHLGLRRLPGRFPERVAGLRDPAIPSVTVRQLGDVPNMIGPPLLGPVNAPARSLPELRPAVRQPCRGAALCCRRQWPYGCARSPDCRRWNRAGAVPRPLVSPA